MSDDENIPVLDDLIERGIEITMSDLGLEDEPPLRVADVLAAESRYNTDESQALDLDLLPVGQRRLSLA